MIKSWLVTHWVTGALFMALGFSALVPLLYVMWTPTLMLIYLHIPGYMLHQVEEHTDDRFRSYINDKVFGGVEALTPGAVLWINLPGVWGVNLAALYLAWFREPGWALAAPYLMLVNAIAHLVNAMQNQEYNPGLGTAILIFLPLGLVSLYAASGSPVQHAIGVAVALAIHATIGLSAHRRAAAAVRA